MKLICKCLQSYRLLFLKYVILYSVCFLGFTDCLSWMTASFFSFLYFVIEAVE